MSAGLKLKYPQVGRSKPPVSHRIYAKSATALKVKTERVSKLVNEVYQVIPYLRPEHRPLVCRWAELEIIIRCAFAGISQSGLFSLPDKEKRDLGVKRLVHD